MRVVPNREAEVPRRLRARRIDYVLAAPEQTDDAGGQVGEGLRIGVLAPIEKRRKRFWDGDPLLVLDDRILGVA